MRARKLRIALAVTTGLCGSLLLGSPAQAQSTVAGNVVGSAGSGGGSTSFTNTTNTTTVTLGNSRTILNWDSLNLASNQTLNFVFAANSDAVLNRVIGGGASTIDGDINGYIGAVGGAVGGNVWILNPNGVLFGSNANVNVGSLLAGTLDIADANFFGGSPYNLSGTGTAGLIVANGAQIATSSGPLVLIGGFVDTAGSLSAAGDVAIAAASDVTVSMAAGSPLSMTISQGTPIGGAVVNAGGTINGSNVYLAVASRTGVMNALLNVTGTVTATSATATDRGIVLAAGTSASGVTVAGGGGNDTAGSAAIQLSGALISATNVEVRASGSVSGTGTIAAADDVSASANGIVLGAIDAGSDIFVDGGAAGFGNGSQDVDLQAGGNIFINGNARGRDIGLIADGAITTGSLSARDDVLVYADGAVVTGAVTSGTTVDALAAVEVAGAGDRFGGMAGNDIWLRGGSVVSGAATANGTGSDVALHGDVGHGSQDLQVSAGGNIYFSSSARGRDIALNAGGAITTGQLTARDDVVVRSGGVASLLSVNSGTTVDSLAAVDVSGAADALAGATLAGHDVNVVGNAIYTLGMTANGSASDIVLDGGATGVGHGDLDLSLAAGGNIAISGSARGRDIALNAGGDVTTGTITARDDVVIRAAGSANTGAVTSGATVDALAAVDADGAGDTLAGATLAGADVRVTGNGVVLGAVRANGTGSDIVLDGGAAGIGSGAADLDLAAGGGIDLNSAARGRDVALSGGDRVEMVDVVARDDIAIRSDAGIGARSLTSGATVDGLGPVDVAGAADALVGANMSGHDIDVLGKFVRVGSATANGGDVRIRRTFNVFFWR